MKILKMQAAIISLLSLSASSISTYAQTGNVITVSGSVSETFLKKFLINEPYMSFYDNYNDQFPEGRQIIPLNIVNNKFHITIRPKGNVGYFMLGNRLGLVVSAFNNLFLVSEGDSIEMDIEDSNHIFFKGKGADKLNFQHWAGNFLLSPDNLVKGWKTGSEPEIIGYGQHLAAKAYDTILDSLNKLSNNYSTSIFNVLWYNTVFRIKSKELEDIAFSRFYCDSTFFNFLKSNVEFIYADQNAFLTSDPYIIKNAFLYSNYIFKLNQIVFQLDAHQKHVGFSYQYNHLKKRYSGILRDKILAYLFWYDFKHNPDELEYLQDARSTISDGLSLYYINKLSQINAPDDKAYDFSVTGLNGKPIKLGDFKGKVLIIDTWYNGCFFCAQLATHLKPIEEYFQHRNDVAFLCLDAVDRDEDRFLKGVKSGRYGSGRSIFAWTNGLGELHPMISYYQYTSYPNLLIIGKNGNIISANPERPIDEKSEADMIALIEKNL